MSTAFEPRDPNWRERVKAIFGLAPFMETLGARVDELGPGWVRSSFPVRPALTQQDGFVHAGAMGALADHSSGAAAGSLMPADKVVLTVEYKLNLLRPAQGERIRCHAQVLRAGSSITVSESEVFAVSGEKETLVAKATVTLAYVALDPR